MRKKAAKIDAGVPGTGGRSATASARAGVWVAAPLCLMLFFVPLVYLRGIFEYSLVPKLLVFHLCTGLACVGWLVQTRFGRDLRLISSPTVLPALCLLAAALLSARSTTHPLDSLVELANQATLIVLFFVAANAFPFRAIPAMLWTTAALGLIVSVIGILQYHNVAFLGIRSNALPSATFANRNLAAEYLICAIPLTGALFLTAQGRGAQMFSGISASLMGVFLVYTRTRSAWVGIAAALLILGAMLALWPGLRRSVLEGVRAEMTRRKWVLACGFLIAFALLSSLPPYRTTAARSSGYQPFIPAAKADISSTVSSIFEKEALKDASVTQRLAFWKGTLRMIADHPVLGVGPGGWIRVYPPYDGGATITREGYHRRPHNDYLWIASEYGLIGLGSYVWFLVAGFGCLVKMARSSDRHARIAAPMFAVSLLSLLGAAFFGFPRELPQTALFPYLLIGIAAMATAEGAKALRPKALEPALLFGLAAVCLVGAELSRRRIEFDRHYLMAYSNAAAAGWGPALAEADRALGYGAFRSDVLFFKGLALQNLGRYEEAGQAYRKTLAYSPHAWYAHDGLAFVDLQQGSMQDALAHYQTALSICPSAPHYIRGNLGVAYFKLQEYDLAEKEFRSALQAAPNDAKYHVNIASLYSVRGPQDSAVAHYREALRLDPSMPEAHLGLANTLLQIGRYQEALPHFEKAAKAHPDDPDVQWKLGLMLESAGQVQGAEGAYRRALRLRPDFVQAHLALGNALFATGRHREALDAYNRFLNGSPQDTAQILFARQRVALCEKAIPR